MNLMFDNKSRGNAGDFLKKNLTPGSRVNVLSSCFTIHAFNELKKELLKTERFRLLLSKRGLQNIGGIAGQLFGKPSDHAHTNLLNAKKIARDCATWLATNADVRESRMPMAPNNIVVVDSPDKKMAAMQGSCEFSSEGLGFSNSKTPMLAFGTNDHQEAAALLDWFNEIWKSHELTHDIKNKILDALDIMIKDASPEFIYYLTLFNIFRTFAEDVGKNEIIKKKTGIENTAIWKMLYAFQRDAVLGVIRKLEDFGGCIIADSVGLGKTFEALAVMKYYELRNCRVLVLAPKKLRENWSIYKINDIRNILIEDRFNYDLLNHTDLSRERGISGEINLETVNLGNYDLLVIDESHNFRNNPPVRGHKTRYQKLMQDIIKSGVKTKVLMLSATPVNNRMSDLKNQIAFVTEGNDDALRDSAGVKSISKTLIEAQRRYNQWAEYPDEERTTSRFLELVNNDYFKLLDALTIARSRKHIQKYYDTSDFGQFPERHKPRSVKTDIDTLGKFPPIGHINDEISRLNLSIYSPVRYVMPEKIKEYSQKYDTTVKDGSSIFRAADREINLVALIRVNLLKRMESSIHSFKITVEKLLAATRAMVKSINSHSGKILEELSDESLASDDPELEEYIIGTKIKVNIADIDAVKMLEDLGDDVDRFKRMLKNIDEITVDRDIKLKTLKEIITEKIKNPINPENRKTLVFTAFADTAEYLYNNLADWALKTHNIHSAIVTGSSVCKSTLKGIKHEFNAILTNFSPVSKKRDKIFPSATTEIDLLIATDCISEGQNLQDCDHLICYDIHWNPVRIIQRFGRIDRLGSKNKCVQLVNFWPNVELDEYINLEARVRNRMVLMNISATGEEDIIQNVERNFMNDLEYRRRQLRQLQTEVMDLEDVKGGIAITDLNFEDFRMDLFRFIELNPHMLENKPPGLHSLCDVDNGKTGIPEGVIFCLRRIADGEPEEKKTINDHYLVFVSNEGDVKIGHYSLKKCLDVFKSVCSGKNAPVTDLCRAFEKETHNYEDMKLYRGLLSASIQSIAGVKDEAGMASLFSLGGTRITPDTSGGADDFEVVTWLIVKRRSNG